jgi:lipopolysaccharide export system protein LptC
MRRKMRFSTIILACFITGLIAYSGSSDTKNRPAISNAERAMAILQGQNTLSRHACYHEAGKHYEELNDIGVKKNGPNARTTTFTNPFGIWEGMDTDKQS